MSQAPCNQVLIFHIFCSFFIALDRHSSTKIFASHHITSYHMSLHDIASNRFTVIIISFTIVSLILLTYNLLKFSQRWYSHIASHQIKPHDNIHSTANPILSHHKTYQIRWRHFTFLYKDHRNYIISVATWNSLKLSYHIV